MSTPRAAAASKGLAGLLQHRKVVQTFAHAASPPAAPESAPAARLAASDVPAPAHAVADEEDPLDAFMSEVATLAAQPASGRMDDLDESFAGDDQDRSTTGSSRPGGEHMQFDDSDEERAFSRKSSDFGGPGSDPLSSLPPSDTRDAFDKVFYRESADAPTGDSAELLRESLGVHVAAFPSGAHRDDVPAPVATFDSLGVGVRYPALAAALQGAGFVTPTPIQAQALPVILAGYDVLGLAQTGSGKTLAYLLPLARHCIAQREIAAGDGPIALVLAPTRELAAQIHAEARKLCHPLGMKCVLLGGGSNKWEQTRALRAGAEVIVCTPGRLIDHVRDRNTSLNRVTYLVLDEADRMFDMGFTTQVYAIISHTRHDRQTVMMSATFKRNVEALASKALTRAVKIVVGSAGGASVEVTQHVYVMAHEKKWSWMSENVPVLLRDDLAKLLVFVASKAAVDELCASLAALLRTSSSVASPSSTAASAPSCVLGLHGDKLQAERDAVLAAFRKGHTRVLVATDVASRGLDIDGVTAVICFDAAKSIDIHVHRIGRTGRFGKDGSYAAGAAITLVTPKQVYFAGALVHNLRDAGQTVPQALVELAQRNPRWDRDAPAAQFSSTGKREREDANPRIAPSTAGLGFSSIENVGMQQPSMRAAADTPSTAPGERKMSSFQRKLIMLCAANGTLTPPAPLQQQSGMPATFPAVMLPATYPASMLAVQEASVVSAEDLPRPPASVVASDTVPATSAGTTTNNDGDDVQLLDEDEEMSAVRSRGFTGSASDAAMTATDAARAELQKLSYSRRIAGISTSFVKSGTQGGGEVVSTAAHTAAAAPVLSSMSMSTDADSSSNTAPHHSEATGDAAEGKPVKRSRWGPAIEAAEQPPVGAQPTATTMFARRLYMPGVRY